MATANLQDCPAARLPGFFDNTDMPDSAWWRALWPDPAGVLAKVGIEPGMDVVDLCAGDGWFTLPIARRARHVAAIDLDPMVLETARRRLDEAGLSNCDLVAGDAYRLKELWPRPVDFVFLANAFHGVPDRPRLARAVRAVLKPGGLFAIVNWHRRPAEQTTVLGEPRGPRAELRMSPEQTIEAVRGILQPTGVVEIAPYHYGAIFQRAA